MTKLLPLLIVFSVALLLCNCSTLSRPQEPRRPLPYIERDCSFNNRLDNTELHGTLTLPDDENVYPVFILIAGSGPADRNEEYEGHKPFFVLSDYLTRRGIAVLRFDKRQKNEPVRKFYQNTIKDFAGDVIAAIDFLKKHKNINPKKIGLIGHSEGGCVSAMVAARNKDVSYVVLLASPGLSFDEVLIYSSIAEYKRDNIPDYYINKNIEFYKSCYSIIKTTQDTNELQSKIKKLYDQFYLNTDLYDKKNLDYMVEKFSLPWFKHIISYRQENDYSSITCPVLALYGELDCQVTSKDNLKALKTAFLKGGNKDVIVIEISRLNHMFQTALTGKQSEYKNIDETFSVEALKIITKWIKLKI